MSGAYKVMYPLPAKQILADGNVQIEMLGLPLAARVAGFILEINGTATTGSSTQAVTPVDLAVLLKGIDLDSDFAYVRATGRLLHVLDRLMNGFAIASAAQSVTATTGGVAVRGMVYLPFADNRSRKPNDTAIPVRLLREKTLNVQFKATALTLGTTNEVTISNGTLRVIAVLVPEDGDVIPTKSKIYFEDWSQATANLNPAHFTHLGIYDESDLAVTDAEYAQLSIAMDGQQLFDRIPTQHLVSRYNQLVPRDAAQELSYQPAASLPFIPVICEPDKYQLTQVPYANGSVRADIDSGSKTSARWFYRQVIQINEGEGRAAAVRLGHDPEASQVSVKTDSKAPLEGSADRVQRHSRLLPKRLHR
jgi:hypothetical protein